VKGDTARRDIGCGENERMIVENSITENAVGNLKVTLGA
jgi:hypothetical protein